MSASGYATAGYSKVAAAAAAAAVFNEDDDDDDDTDGVGIIMRRSHTSSNSNPFPGVHLDANPLPSTRLPRILS